MAVTPGEVVKTFGEFVIQGDVVVGLVIFLIIVLVQFIVITKGSERVAEVSARFTLDAMPGKQMAIDADLSSGLIDEAQARIRRSKIQREADFSALWTVLQSLLRATQSCRLLRP